EPDILEFIRYNLEKESYTVFTAENGSKAIELAQQLQPHLLLLDVMMPELDGIETCRELGTLPGLKSRLYSFLTARNEDYSQIAGFDVGADDYITKPIKPRVLISRIKGLLRRFTNETPDEKVKLGNIEIDPEKYIVYKDGNELNLPKKEF